MTNDLKLFLDVGQHVETVVTEYFKSAKKRSRALFGSRRALSSHLSTGLGS